MNSLKYEMSVCCRFGHTVPILANVRIANPCVQKECPLSETAVVVVPFVPVSKEKHATEQHCVTRRGAWCASTPTELQ